ncbi:GyrI-like domain-containing protein [Cytobacillus depressus]|uniref:GyrI-like domain-containing protein n=1 Tax=Cytobacillus depressus TaxID=1602942 RepID=A0A6L3UXK4_9BACI|nr:GyrI-like domain-containing protein [Cytobacillus depressus]KAB2328685.1 GyrI-like domain-containing protein [Cytobacillus depressus]
MSETIIQNKTIKELDELRLVGFRVLCSGDQYLVEIPKASLRLCERISKIKQVVNPIEQFGAFVVEKETADDDGYWVCVEVKEYEDIPTDMVTLTIPPQKYAAMRHKGSNYKIMEAYNDLHKWIEENNFIRLKNKWHIERFYDWKDTQKVDVELLDTIE